MPQQKYYIRHSNWISSNRSIYTLNNRRVGRAAEGAPLLREYTVYPVSRVRIPHSPPNIFNKMLIILFNIIIYPYISHIMPHFFLKVRGFMTRGESYIYMIHAKLPSPSHQKHILQSHIKVILFKHICFLFAEGDSKDVRNSV